MAKRRKSKAHTNSKLLTISAWFLAVVALTLSSLVGGYYLGYENAKEDFAKLEKIEKEKKVAYLKKMEETTKKQDEKSVNEKLKDVLKKEEKQNTPVSQPEPEKEEIKSEENKKVVPNYTSASHELDDDKPDIVPLTESRELKKTYAKPRVAIIIDDVSTRSHVKAIKALSMPITMSFLPPSADRPNSAKLAAQENTYMVHLPMEAQSFSAEEPATMRINDSQEKISSRIKEIKTLFPNVHYLNNHTGSKFTSDEAAMQKLMYALQSNGINFIDSRTTAKTQARKVMKNLNLPYVSRDVFLDHHMDKEFVHKQIKQVIEIAKKHGSAIAIGHPHKNTILALHEAKKLFDDVELVYINKMY